MNRLVSHNDDEEIEVDVSMETVVSSSTEENASKIKELTEGDKEVPLAKSMKCDELFEFTIRYEC